MEICYPDSTDWSCLSEVELASMDPDIKARSEMLAWRSLQRLTGGRLALCPIVIRPCAARCNPSGWVTAPVDGGGYQPFIRDGRWYNGCGCSSPSVCSCTMVSEIRLPGEVSGPVVVTIGGATLDSSAYRIDNGNRLVRTDGDVWPMCQDMSVDDGDDTFTVSYFKGIGPDTALNYAAGLLAVEWYKSCKGVACALPQGVTRVTRQGISFDIATGSFDSGYSGIRAVDDIVGMYNPYRLRTRTTVLSPDTLRHRQRTY